MHISLANNFHLVIFSLKSLQVSRKREKIPLDTEKRSQEKLTTTHTGMEHKRRLTRVFFFRLKTFIAWLSFKLKQWMCALFNLIRVVLFQRDVKRNELHPLFRQFYDLFIFFLFKKRMFSCWCISFYDDDEFDEVQIILCIVNFIILICNWYISFDLLSIFLWREQQQLCIGSIYWH